VASPHGSLCRRRFRRKRHCYADLSSILRFVLHGLSFSFSTFLPPRSLRVLVPGWSNYYEGSDFLTNVLVKSTGNHPFRSPLGLVCWTRKLEHDVVGVPHHVFDELILICSAVILPALSRLNFPKHSVSTTASPFPLTSVSHVTEFIHRASRPPTTATKRLTRVIWGRCVGSEVRDLLRHSPTGLGRIESQYSYGLVHSPLVALHPFLLKNAVTIRLGAVNGLPDRDFHPAIQSPSQAALTAFSLRRVGICESREDSPT